MQLRDAFRDWAPKTSVLRDLKRRLQHILKVASGLFGGDRGSKL